MYSHSPLDDTTGAQLEGQRCFALVAGIELGSVGLQRAAVVHGDSVAVGSLASALDSVGCFDAELGGGSNGAESGDEDGGETHCVVMRWIGKRGSWGDVDRCAEMGPAV